MSKLTNGLIVGLIAILIFYSTRRPAIKVTEKLLGHYDYIVVGAGSAGSVVANRLSEDPDVTVLLLEAGPAEHAASEIPGMAAGMPLFPVNWNYRAEPEKHCCGDFNDNVIKWHTGRMLGGSSSINYMVYLRGSRHDYDRWEAQGCEGWGYDDVLPYFIKSEKIQDPSLAKSGYYGSSGPLKVSSPETQPVNEAVLEAARELGFKVTDLNGEDQLGFGVPQIAAVNGRRSSTAECYLRPAMSRENLHIATESMVAKVLISDKKAEGVEFIRNGKTQTVKSKREVIVSGGTVSSAQILMLSGIGPKHHLQEHKIDVVADLPVGEKLENHYFVREPAFLLDKPLTFTEDEAMSFKTDMEYKIFGSGLLSGNGIGASGFIRTKNQPKEDKFPYLQIFTINTAWGSGPNSAAMNKAVFNYKPEIFDALHGGQDGKHVISFGQILIHPFSKGKIRLRSANPLDHPVIHGNVMADSRDAQVLAEGIKLGESFADTEAFKSIGAKMLDRLHPSCKHLKPKSDEYYECFARQNAYTIYHPSSTCKMGPDSDPEAVVDIRLKVKGITGLRVADASIMPFVTSGNTNAPTIMIGEKASDIIKQDWKSKR